MSQHPNEAPSGPKGLLRRAATLSYDRPLVVLALIALMSAAAWRGASDLEIDTDMAALLPDDAPSVRALDALRDEFGGEGTITLVVSDAPPAELERVVDELAARLIELGTVRYVDAHRPVEFFEEHALYYLSEEALQTLADRVDERILWEKRRANPLFVDVGDRVPPEIRFDEIIEDGAETAALGDADGLGGAETRYYRSDDRSQYILFVKPRGTAADFGAAQEAIHDVESALLEFDSNATIELTGRFKKRVDVQGVLARDLRVMSGTALLLIVLYVAWHFRRMSAVALLLVPLLLGLLWTFGYAGFVFGRLNIVTVFIGAILLGLGVDHGIHLIEHFYRHLADTPGDVRGAVGATFDRTGRAVAGAALTTGVGFGALAISDFGAFQEFGLIAAVGMVLIALAYFTALPAAIRALDVLPFGRAPVRVPRSSWALHLDRWAPLVAWIAALGLFAAAVYAPGVSFDYDLGTLDDVDVRSYELDRQVNRILGRSQTPLAVEARTRPEERALVDAVNTERDARGATSSVDFALSLESLVPNGQERKRQTMREIAASLEEIEPDDLAAGEREKFEALRRAANALPVARERIPREVQRIFTGTRPTDEAGRVLIFPQASLSTGEGIRAIADEVAAIELPDGAVRHTAGDSIVMADVIELITQETPPVLVLTLALVFVALFVVLGGLGGAILAITPALATILGVFGVMAGTGLELNYLNIIAIPVLFGIGVDGGIHLVTRIQGGEPLSAVVAHAGRAIAASLLTTALGFGAPVLASHAGLRSFGMLALLGIAINVVASIVLLPSMIALGRRLRARWSEPGELRPAPGRFAVVVSTVGGAGFAPLAPGTLGALVALPVAWALSGASVGLWLSVLIVATAIGVVAAARYIPSPETDPSEVVMDELVGCLIALAFVPFSLFWALAAFALFRVLDIWKPLGIRLAEQRLTGPWAIMMDDVAAGLLAGAMLLGAHGLFDSFGWI